MGLTGAKGSLEADVQQPTDVVIQTVDEVAELDFLPRQPEIYRASHNSTVLTEDANADIRNVLKGYIEGTTTEVTWFSQIKSDADTVENFSDISFLSDSITSSYLEIRHMEVKLTSEFSFSFDEDTASSNLTGELVTYPGFRPRAGDLFITTVGRGQFGLFKVSEVPERLTIRAGTANRVQFSLMSILETADYTKLKERVRNVAYFDKKRFMLEPGALLTHDEVVDLRWISQTMQALDIHYGSKFYDVGSKSIFLPDYVYDPYVVRFYHEVMGLYVDKNYITQLFDNKLMENWQQTIWYKLLTRDNIADLVHTASEDYVTTDRRIALINGLLNRKVKKVDSAGELTYVSEWVLTSGVSNYSTIDDLVTAYVLYGIIRYDILKDLANNIRSSSVSDEDQFYHIPIILFLLKKMEQSYRGGLDVPYTTEPLDPYTEYKFTNVDLDVETVVLKGILENDIIGMLTDTGEAVRLTDIDIAMVGSDAFVNLTPVMTILGITEITGTWKVILKNTLLEG